MSSYENQVNNDYTRTSTVNNAKVLSPEEHEERITLALEKVSDRLDEGHCDEETVKLVGELHTALIGVLAEKTDLVPVDPDPEPVIPIPLETTLSPQRKGEISRKLFAWIRLYTLNALFTMPGVMLENSSAIQAYIYNGLNRLSQAVMQSSQAWSDFGQASMAKIQEILQNVPADQTKRIGDLTTLFNMYNTSYQKNLELFGALNEGIAQTSSSTTQTQTLNNQNITQGPLAMLAMLTQCWAVIV